MVLKRMEGQLAFDFASKAHLNGIDVSLDRPVALLSAMRHFGVPTRVLDWSYSPYVGLYFAFEAESEAKASAVWALDVNVLQTASTFKALAIEERRSGTKSVPPLRSLDFGQDRIFEEFVLPDLAWYHRTLLLGEPAIENVVAMVPHTQNVRLSAQQGLFICPSQVGPSLVKQMESLLREKGEWLVKIVIPRSLRTEILKRLFQMNIHPLSLFPGPDGLGKFCALKAELFGWQ